MIDKKRVLENLNLEPSRSIILEMKNKIIKGATYVVTWKQQEKDFKDEINVE